MAAPHNRPPQSGEALVRHGLAETPVSYGRQVWRRFRRNRLAVAGALVLLTLMLVTLFSPVLAPHDPNAPALKKIYAKPSAEHPLGTDQLGRDSLSRLLVGGRIPFLVAFTSVAIYLTVGVVVGGVAGYFGGWVDGVLMRLADVVLAFPYLLLILTLAAVFGPGVGNLILIFSLSTWPVPARLVRGQFLSIRELEYVEAAHAMGLPRWRVIWRHMLPNAVAPLIVFATLDIATIVLTESVLSFLGLGVRDPLATWGNLLTEATSFSVLKDMPWLWVPPGLAIFLAVLSFNYVGDGLRDALDPRLKL